MWLCLITKIRVRVVEVNWLREVLGEDDVYELDPQEWKGWATVRIKLIYDPCSRVKEVTQGGGPRRWSRPRAPSAASEDADAAEEEGAGEAGAAGSSSGAVDEMECEPPSSPPAREQPVLRGTARQRYGSGAVLSDDPREWLNDESSLGVLPSARATSAAQSGLLRLRTRSTGGSFRRARCSRPRTPWRLSTAATARASSTFATACTGATR